MTNLLTYNSLFVVTLVALASPWMSHRIFRGFIPAVVLEILLGILLGQSGFHIASSTPFVDFLANFGFSYLMFLSGLELDFTVMTERLETGTKPHWVRGVLFFLTVLLISLVVAYLLQWFGWISHPFIVALILSTTSTGILTPSLKESGWLNAKFGQELLVYGLIADMACLVMIAAFVALHTTGNALSVMLVMVLIAVCGVVYRGLRHVKETRGFNFITNATSEIGLRGSFALILMFLALSQTLGTEVVVGAFLAGAVVSLLSERHSLLSKKLNSIGYGFLLPIFFVNVGLKFGVSSLSSKPGFWAVLILLFVVTYVNRFIPAQYFLRRFPFRQRVAGGALLSAGLSLVIAVSQIGMQIGMLTPATANGFIILAVATCLVSPATFSKIMKRVPMPEDVHLPLKSLKLDADSLPSGWVVDKIEVLARRWDGVPMRRIRVPQDVLFVSILRGEERIIPRGHTTLEQFDQIQLLGDPQAIERIRTTFSVEP